MHTHCERRVAFGSRVVEYGRVEAQLRHASGLSAPSFGFQKPRWQSYLWPPLHHDPGGQLAHSAWLRSPNRSPHDPGMQGTGCGEPSVQ